MLGDDPKKKSAHNAFVVVAVLSTGADVIPVDISRVMHQQ